MRPEYKNTMISALAGAVGAAVVFTFLTPLLATTSPQVIEDAIESGQCSAAAGFGRLTGGSRCFSGEVMTGQSGDYIYCADIIVTCSK